MSVQTVVLLACLQTNKQTNKDDVTNFTLCSLNNHNLMLKLPYVWLFQPLNYGLKQTVKHLVEMTILFLPKNMGCLNYR